MLGSLVQRVADEALWLAQRAFQTALAVPGVVLGAVVTAPLVIPVALGYGVYRGARGIASAAGALVQGAQDFSFSDVSLPEISVPRLSRPFRMAGFAALSLFATARGLEGHRAAAPDNDDDNRRDRSAEMVSAARTAAPARAAPGPEALAGLLPEAGMPVPDLDSTLKWFGNLTLESPPPLQKDTEVVSPRVASDSHFAPAFAVSAARAQREEFRPGREESDAVASRLPAMPVPPVQGCENFVPSADPAHYGHYVSKLVKPPGRHAYMSRTWEPNEFKTPKNIGGVKVKTPSEELVVCGFLQGGFNQYGGLTGALNMNRESGGKPDALGDCENDNHRTPETCSAKGLFQHHEHRYMNVCANKEATSLENCSSKFQYSADRYVLGKNRKGRPAAILRYKDGTALNPLNPLHAVWLMVRESAQRGLADIPAPKSEREVAHTLHRNMKTFVDKIEVPDDKQGSYEWGMKRYKGRFYGYTYEAPKNNPRRGADMASNNP